MRANIFGRNEEIERLEEYVDSNRSEFIAIYGRRRVGKTFLVRELFEGRLVFRMSGMENVDNKKQLLNFSFAINEYFGVSCDPENWLEAFRLLFKCVEQSSATKKIIFIDELPWLDTYGSDFVSALDYFWNNYASYRNDVKLIICGSSTSWMLSNVINNHGGLHNRVTHQIALKPFNLCETESYFKSREFYYDRQEILQAYMAVGGVPYYLSLFSPKCSVSQNISNLCFKSNGELHFEYPKLLKSLFSKSDNYVSVINAIHTRLCGLSRSEIVEATKLPNNGYLTRILSELEQCDFIRSYQPWGKTKKDALYQLIDPFTLFYFRFLQGNETVMDDYWQKVQLTDAYSNWCGYAFEVVCLNHLEQIVNAMGISGSLNTPCSWYYKPSKKVLQDEEPDEDLLNRAQIDLLIDRSDNMINVCEMKYSLDEYVITKETDQKLQRRIRIFKKVSKTRKTIVPMYVTANGLAGNSYSRRIFSQVIGDDLFAF